VVEGDVECSELPGPDEGSLSGEKAGGSFLIEQARLVASKVRGQVVAGSGHWLMKEAPDAVIPAIRDFVA
jgi:pimeloyl-ACP methyl ester carboxylesterase